jgi:uncharacterized protein YqfA (UPF0365 family)
MRNENGDVMGKLETTETDAEDMAQAAVELCKSMARMSDKELEIAIDLAHEDVCKANDELEYARMNRELQNMRVTIMEYEQIRRGVCSE